LAEDPVDVVLNHTHALSRSVAPSESVYCNENVCVAPVPLLGVTEAAEIATVVKVAVQANGAIIVTTPSAQSASPLHADSVHPACGVGSSCTYVPKANVATHLPTQTVPDGASVTCAPLPTVVTANGAVDGTSEL
jgi:hypothetical protein